jgi:hypothetical protein
VDEDKEECDEMVENEIPIKIHVHAYKLYTRSKHDILMWFGPRTLPVCMQGEIMDSWPDLTHEYVGFHLALKEAEED